jgi:hypothetical protein
MEQNRADKISQVLKNVATLGQQVKVPGSSAISRLIPESRNAIGIPVQGTGFVRILMYIVAGLLLIGIILLGVDQWVTPIFQRSPGAPGYIPIPGTDLSQVFWEDAASVGNIIVGSVPPAKAGYIPPLSVSVIEAQTAYSLTLDVFINDEYPQSLPSGETMRIFFLMGQNINNPTLQVCLDNNKNTVYITSFDSAGFQQSISLDNVPIYTSFRIGITMSHNIMEAYMNGLLVNTKRITSVPKSPSSGDTIFATSNIKSGSPAKVLSKGIGVLNVRAFGYVVPPSEMKGRMSDLTSNKSFKKTK